MSNMSYCRFSNTVNDLYDCFDNMDEQTDELSDGERKARLELIQICCDICNNNGYEINRK